jgi:hypothetical protein
MVSFRVAHALDGSTADLIVGPTTVTCVPAFVFPLAVGGGLGLIVGFVISLKENDNPAKMARTLFWSVIIGAGMAILFFGSGGGVAGDRP